MQNDRSDFPISIALLIAGVVLGSFFYLQTFGHDPSVLNALGLTLRKDAMFWTTAFVAMTMNISLIGAWLRRTIGLKKQGSRLQKLDGKSQQLFHREDRYAIGVMAVTFLATKNVSHAPLTRVFEVIGFDRPIWTEISLVGNFVLLAGCLWLLLVRIVPRFQSTSAPELSVPPYKPMTLVLGTTPMEVQ